MNEHWLLLAGSSEGLLGYQDSTKAEALIRDSIGVASGPGVRVWLQCLLAVCLGMQFDPYTPPLLLV